MRTGRNLGCESITEPLSFSVADGFDRGLWRDMAEMGWATYAVPPAELAGFTERFARRMANIDNDMLMYSKRAVNRQYEAMGIRTGLMSGTDVEAMSKHRPAAQEWNRRLREEGLKAALEWRDGPFRDFRGAYASAPADRPVAGTEGKAPEPNRPSGTGYNG